MSAAVDSQCRTDDGFAPSRSRGTRQRRCNRYGDGAALVAFVAGPEASSITGEPTVDGGANA